VLLLFCLERKMAKNYQQDGTTLDFQNTGATDIHSGDAVLSGALVGVAHDDIPAGCGACCIPGRFRSAKGGGSGHSRPEAVSGRR
jgi:predicted RecA/RadA family phage recombinase